MPVSVMTLESSQALEGGVVLLRYRIESAEVAQRAGLNQRTISKLEGESDFSSKDLRRRRALEAIRTAFEKDGIEFIFPSQTSGPGVRMRAAAQTAD